MEAFLVLVILKGSEDDDSSSSSPRIPPPDSTSLLLECRRYGEPLKKLMLLSQERWHRQISQFTLFSPLIHHTHHFTTTDSEIRVPKKKRKKKKKTIYRWCFLFKGKRKCRFPPKENIILYSKSIKLMFVWNYLFFGETHQSILIISDMRLSTDEYRLFC